VVPGSSSGTGPGRRHAGRAPWVAGILGALLAFSALLAVIAWLDDEPPQLRVSRTGGRLSTEIVDRDTRIFVVNSPDREDVRAALGRFTWPWQNGPQLLVAPPDREAAVGLWEALQRTDPARVIVAGVPGADPLWLEVERYCDEEGIELTFLTTSASLDTERLTITIIGSPPEYPSPSSVVVRYGGANVVIALDERQPATEGQVLVSSAESPRTSARVVVTSWSEPRAADRDEVVVERREVVEIVLDDGQLRIFGGRRRGPQEGR
jgi:hypothetical protein